MLRAGEKAAPKGLRTWPIGSLAALATGLILASGGCTFLLDFDEPVEPGEESDAGFDASDIDAGNAPDADTAPDASLAANCSEFEPNNNLGQAIAITPTTLQAAICPDSDSDFYSFSLLSNTNLTLTLVFDNTSSNLDLNLYNSVGAVVAAAVGTDATEVVARGPGLGNALPAGDYRVEVLSATGDVSVDYTLTLELEPGLPSAL